jgi:hypothetical protein
MKPVKPRGQVLLRSGTNLLAATALVATACSETARLPVEVPTNPPIDKPTAPQPPIAIVSGDKQRGRPGHRLAEPLVVRVTDPQGVAVPDAAVKWSVDWPFGVLGEHRGLCPEDGDIVGHRIYVTTSTDADGLATMSFVPTSVSTLAVHAELVDVENARVWFGVDARDADASVEIVSGDDQQAVGPDVEGEPLVVRATDGSGAPLPNVTVIWSVLSGDVVLDSACSQHISEIDWIAGEQVAFEMTLWAVRTEADGTAAVGFLPGTPGTSEASARLLGRMDGVTFTIEATSQ